MASKKNAEVTKFDFTIPEHYTRGLLSGDDLAFFYYDIGLDDIQKASAICDWDSIVEEFKDEVDIDSCSAEQIPTNYVKNRIRFTKADDPKKDDFSKAVAFMRHLRNAFAHYRIVREEDNYLLNDRNLNDKPTMIGLVNANLLKKFCLRFIDERERIIDDKEQSKLNQHV